MKVGILTFSPRLRYNHGSILQCLALQNILNEMGHEVRVIKFYNDSSTSLMRRFIAVCSTPMRGILYMMQDFFTRKKTKRLPFMKKYNVKSEKFYKTYIHATEECSCKSIRRIINEEELEAVIIGSDKVWGGVSQKQLVYFGDWESEYSGKIISYAACSSQMSIPLFNKSKIKYLLSRFQGISVRDQHTLRLIQPFTDMDVKIVADPTLLYNFNSLISPYNGSSYIFAYILGGEIEGGHEKLFSEIRKKVGDLPIKAIVLPGESIDIEKYTDDILYDASPEDWVNWLANSAFVYTDSYHATLFALKYQKPFISFYREKNRSSRLLDLTKMYNLDGYIVSSLTDAIDKKRIGKLPDYIAISNKMQQQQEYSLSFLKKILM